MFRSFLVFISLFGFCAYGQIPQVDVLVDSSIFEKAPFKQCHASTLVEAANGDILAAWFGGEYERHPDVSIYQSTKTDTGWSKPLKIADGQTANDTLTYPTWNPVLFKNTENDLLLYYKEGPSPSRC